MLCRETTAFAAAAIALLFVAGYATPRRHYVLIGIGCATIVVAETLLLWALTGHPLYRFHIAANHDADIDRWIDQGAAIPLLHPLVDPITMLLLNHDFALTFWIGIPLTIYLLRRSTLPQSTRHLATLGLTLALTWSALSAGLWTVLVLIPRYFLLPSIIASMLTGLAFASLWPHHRRLTAALGTALLASNLLALELDNRNFMFGEHTLVTLAAQHPGPIHTDPSTLRHAELLLAWQHLQDRVTPLPPQPGDLVYLNPSHLPPGTTPPPSASIIARQSLPSTIAQRLIDRLLPNQLPPRLYNRLGPGAPEVTLYRQP